MAGRCRRKNVWSSSASPTSSSLRGGVRTFESANACVTAGRSACASIPPPPVIKMVVGALIAHAQLLSIGEFVDGLGRQPTHPPVGHDIGAHASIELDRRLVPIEHRPLHPPA